MEVQISPKKPATVERSKDEMEDYCCPDNVCDIIGQEEEETTEETTEETSE